MTTNKAAFSASLRVKGTATVHRALTAETGLNPTHSHEIGDAVHPELSSGRKWKNSIWCFDSPLPDTHSLTEHLLWLAEAIRPHLSYFHNLIENDIEIDLYCSFFPDSDTGGFSIDPAALRFVSELGVPLEVSVILT